MSDTSRPRTGRRIVAVLVFAVLVAAGLMAYADISSLTQDLSTYRWWTFAAALGLATLNYMLRFLRWEWYLRELKISVPTLESAIIFVAGFLMSITPGKLGEVYKSMLLFERRGIPVARTAPIVIAERLTDLAALVLLTALGSLVFVQGRVTALVGALLVTAGLLSIGVRPLGLRLARGLAKLPLIRHHEGRLLTAYESLYELVRPRPLVLSTAIACLSWFLESIALYLICMGFMGADLGMLASIFAYSAPTIVGAVALLPGGIGVTEASMTGVLVKLGNGTISTSTAAAATILVRLATLWWAVVLGAFATLWFRKLNALPGTAVDLPARDEPTRLDR